MKMDIGCPAELIGFEQAEFAEGQHKAYLTFLNESQDVITALSGRLTFFDAEGVAVEDERVAFGDVLAKPGERFVCHMPLDGYPPFATVAMLVEDVLFDDAEPWALHPMRLKEYETPALEDGPARRALVAVCGEDAVCYPEHQGNVWVCVCGRFNRWRWVECRRCGRERDRTLAITPEETMATYERMQDPSAPRPQRPEVQRKPRPTPEKRHVIAEAPKRKARVSSKVMERVLAIVLGLLFVVGIVLGARSLLHKLPQSTTADGQQVMDVLEPK